MISEVDIEKLATAARKLAPSASAYLEEDFVMNLLETVLDYMLQTEVVVKALERFREHRWHEVRSLDDLEQLLARFPADQAHLAWSSEQPFLSVLFASHSGLGAAVGLVALFVAELLTFRRRSSETTPSRAAERDWKGAARTA